MAPNRPSASPQRERNDSRTFAREFSIDYDAIRRAAVAKDAEIKAAAEVVPSGETGKGMINTFVDFACGVVGAQAFNALSGGDPLATKMGAILGVAAGEALGYLEDALEMVLNPDKKVSLAPGPLKFLIYSIKAAQASKKAKEERAWEQN